MKDILALQYQEKFENLVHVLKIDATGKKFVVKFIDNIQGVILHTDTSNDFIHYCEAAANNRGCTHNATAFAISKKLGYTLDRFGLPSAINDITELVGTEDYSDINPSIGLETADPVEEEDATTIVVPASSSTSAPVTPKPSSKLAQARDWKKDWASVENFLNLSRIPRSIVAKIKAKRKEVFANVALTPMVSEPTAPGTPYIGDMLQRALKHILMGKSLLLVGDKGSGKDTLINTLSWVLGYPQYLQTGHKGYTAETLVGDNMPTGNGLEVAFKYTAYATSVMNGGMVHFAELNMLQPDATSIFHSVYDDNRELSTPNGTVNKHAEHVFVASINVGENYAGVKALNAALKDRLAVLHLPYTIDFKELIEKKTGLTDNHVLEFLYSIKKSIDLLYNNEGIGDESRTIRGYIDAANHLREFGINEDNKVEAIEDFVINKTENREDRFAIRDQLRTSCWPTLVKTQEEIDYENGAA